MGRGIDRIMLLSLLAGALYIFFIGAMGSIPLSAAAAFIALALLKKLTERLPKGKRPLKRKSEAEARAELEKFALTGDSDARDRLTASLERAYPGELESAELEYLPGHYNGTKLTTAEICALWKRHAGKQRLVIATPSRAEESAFRLAERLTAHEVRVIDHGQLVSILAAYPAERADMTYLKPPKRVGHLTAAARAACKARAGKCLMTGAVMAAIYFITGTFVYLLGSLLLIFIAGVSFRERSKPLKLFG